MFNLFKNKKKEKEINKKKEIELQLILIRTCLLSLSISDNIDRDFKNRLINEMNNYCDKIEGVL